MNFGNALFDLLLGDSGQVSANYSGSHILVFAIGSMVMGVLTMILDWIVFTLLGRSFFGMSYSGIITTIRLIILWAIGAGIGSLIGASMSIFQLTRAGCIGASFAWPLILPRLIKLFGEREDDQPPENGK